VRKHCPYKEQFVYAGCQQTVNLGDKSSFMCCFLGYLDVFRSFVFVNNPGAFEF